MNILITAAHPDDELLGVGGTIAKRISQGHNVYICIFADGATARHDALKQQATCARQASKVMGVKKLFLLGLKDQQLDTYPILTLTKELEKIMSEIHPQVVYTHHRGDLNMDHRLVCEATLVASRPVRSSVKELYCFETVSATEWNIPNETVFSPNTYENISEFYERKMLGLAEYSKTFSNELEIFPHPRSVEAIEALAKKRGSECGCLKAEAFMQIRRIND